MVNKLLKKDINFKNLVTPVIDNKEYAPLKEIPHHNGTVFEHCMLVAYYSYKLAKMFGLDIESTIKGALLHDFYLYKYKKTPGKNFIIEAFKHALNHPKIAHKNAIKHFELNKKEANIIKSHMFPVGFPRYAESWIITFVDKVVAVFEYSTRVKSYVKKYKTA